MAVGMFAQSHLKERGWSPKLIETLLGPPDQTARNPVYRSKAPMRLWERTRVEAAEKHPDFLVYQAKRAKASARSKAVAERKQRELLDKVDAIDIYVKRWPLPKLLRAAVWEWEQMGAERGEYLRDGADADDATKNRWAVNYVRHNLVYSGQDLILFPGQTGINKAEAALEHKIYDAIAELYPDLAEEALSQAERLWGSVRDHQRVPTPEVTWPAKEISADFNDVHHNSSRSLQIAGFARFREKTRSLPTITEARYLRDQRIGQDVFRDMLMEFWSGRCAITGLDQPELLRASHLKPWAACSTDTERLYLYNGLLLSAYWDAALDRGLVTLQDDGTLLLSEQLTSSARQLLSPDARSKICVHRFEAAHLPYFQYHREQVWCGY